MNAPVVPQTINPPSIVTEAALQQADSTSEILEVTAADGLDLADISDVAEAPDSGIDVKATSDFTVVFRNAEGKKIKGQTEAAENICTVRFARAIGGDTASSEGPKKRGRKSEAEKAAKVNSTQLNIVFWDDDQNVSVDFLEALADREDFTVEVSSTGEARNVLETFTFEGCNVVPQIQFQEFNNSVPGTPRTLSLSLGYSEMTRTSAGDEADE